MGRQEREGVIAIPGGDALFTSLFGQNSVGVAVGSPEGRFLRVNDALCRMLGYEAEELLNRSFGEITHPDDQQASQDFQQELLTRSRSGVYEKRYLCKDGSTLWVRITGTFLRDDSGSPLCSVALVYDITKLKLAEEALKASENRFRRMVEMSSDWYWVQDEHFRFVALAGMEKRGVGEEVFIGRARWELPHVAPLPEAVWQRHRDVLERHEPFSDFVYAATESSGELRYLSVTGEPIFDAEGRFRGYHGIGKDVTATAQAQKALEDSELRYRMLFDIHPHPMWVVEAKTLRFLAVNQAAVDQYGYTREEFLSMTAEQLRYPEDIAKLLRDFQDQSRSYMQRVARHRKKNGDEMAVEIVSFNLEFDGKPARLGVINDVTNRLKSEAQARELEQRYKELLASQEPRGR
jgi:PAS domain S-box-containing protein